jgi:carboxypeptidase Q
MKGISLFLATASALAAADAPMAGQYHDVSARLVGAALSSDAGLNRLEYLCDRIGNRVSGSAALEKAVVWAEEEMKRAGLENVRTIPVKVPHWVRGHEALTMLEPVARPVPMLGLGNSAGTPSAGVEAEVVTVSDFAELSKLGREKVAGKIVLYNAPYESYGATVMYRTSGASQAARLGRWRRWCVR